MKLLIVDDEICTRKGMLQIINWEALGIHTVVSAENGEAGLSMARRIRPDIVITDIRMPKTDGISMAEMICEIVPHCRIIFISAYSDKMYYMGAIKLKAVRYLEKPIDVADLEQAVRQAVIERREFKKVESSNEITMGTQLRKVAAAMMRPETGSETETNLIKIDAGWSSILKAYSYITTAIVKLCLTVEGDEEAAWQEIIIQLGAVSGSMKIKYICTPWGRDKMVIYLFTAGLPRYAVLSYFCGKISESIQANYKFNISVGKTVMGISRAHESYFSASQVMRKAFFCPYGHVLLYDANMAEQPKVENLRELKKIISKELYTMNAEGALQSSDKLFELLKNNTDINIGKIKEVYYELLAEVFRLADEAPVNISSTIEPNEANWVLLTEAYNLIELHQFFVMHIERLFEKIENRKSEKTQISIIKDFIGKNYLDESLSVNDISIHLHISVSHICTIFKRETGFTINQYLTDFRIERAKRYLKDTRLCVSEISTKVGYRDNSYFGRLFRKMEGVTPLEYREGMNV